MAACVLTPPVDVEEVEVAMVERRKAIRCMGFLPWSHSSFHFSFFDFGPVNKFGTITNPDIRDP